LDLYKTAVAEMQARNSAPINALGNPTIQALLAAFLNPNKQAGSTNVGDPLGIFTLPTKSASTINQPKLSGGVAQPTTSGASATFAPPVAQQPKPALLPSNFLNGYDMSGYPIPQPGTVGGLKLTL
jgi:hypothetical protein